MTGLDLLAMQILALKSQLGAFETQLVTLEQSVESMRVNEAAEGVCIHGETENVGTFGVPDIRCTTCGERVNAS